MITRKVVVTGASGIVGSRVAAHIAEKMPAANVVGVDRFGGTSELSAFHLADLATADLTAMFADADVVVHCSFNVRADAVTAHDGRLDLAVLGRVLDAAAVSGVQRFVVLSSAMVYGAWPDNNMPLTEEASVRPNPDFAFAVHMASVEQVATNWAAEDDGRELTIIRPAVVVSEERRGGLSDLLASASTIRSEEGDAPAQYLHVDDLASAVAAAVAADATGPLNVAPDSWINAEGLAALAGPKPRLHLPDPAVKLVADARFRLGFTNTPPGIQAYTTHSWVVSNDRMKALGWEPNNSNEEAYVSGHDAGPLGELNAQKRQMLSLGATAAVVIAIVAAIAALIRRASR